MIYLRASIEHLVGNIQKRGRDYEQTMKLDYLKGLNRQYDEFISNSYTGRVLTIDVNNLDYEHNPEDFRFITDKIDQIIYGLFPLDDNSQEEQTSHK